MIHTVQTALLMIFPALVILGGVKDLVSYRIPNWISLALIAGFLAAAGAGLAAGAAPGALAMNLAAGLAGLVLGVALFALGWIGGGDAKLFAAAALWLGWPAVPVYLGVTGIAGGAVAVGLLSLRSPLVAGYVVNSPAWLRRLAEPGENVPYGVAIAVGGLTAFPASALMQGLGHMI